MNWKDEDSEQSRSTAAVFGSASVFNVPCVRCVWLAELCENDGAIGVEEAGSPSYRLDVCGRETGVFHVPALKDGDGFCLLAFTIIMFLFWNRWKDGLNREAAHYSEVGIMWQHPSSSFCWCFCKWNGSGEIFGWKEQFYFAFWNCKNSHFIGEQLFRSCLGLRREMCLWSVCVTKPPAAACYTSTTHHMPDGAEAPTDVTLPAETGSSPWSKAIHPHLLRAAFSSHWVTLWRVTPDQMMSLSRPPHLTESSSHTGDLVPPSRLCGATISLCDKSLYQVFRLLCFDSLVRCEIPRSVEKHESVGSAFHHSHLCCVKEISTFFNPSRKLQFENNVPLLLFLPPAHVSCLDCLQNIPVCSKPQIGVQIGDLPTPRISSYANEIVVLWLKHAATSHNVLKCHELAAPGSCLHFPLILVLVLKVGLMSKG